MTQLFTCSYSAYRPDMGTAVRITLGRPRQPEPSGRASWIYLAELAPRGWYFKAPPDVFARRYAEQLDRLAAGIDEKIEWLTEHYGPLVLLCYERRVNEEACHRRAFARFWQDRHQEAVPELDGRRTQ